MSTARKFKLTHYPKLGDNLGDSSESERYSLIKHLAMIAGGADWRSVRLSAFTAYFDAAGTEHDQPCLAVAGYVALAEQWIDFEKQWTARLGEDGLEYFQSNLIRSLWWNDLPRTERLYRDLIKIISDHVLQRFGCCIINRSLEKWSKDDRNSWNISAFSMAGRTCAGQLRGWAKRQGMQSLPEMIFEDGETDKGTLIELLKADGYPVPIFKLKKDAIKKGLVVKAAIPLQAADLLASECFGPMRELEQLGYITEIRWQYEELEKIPGTSKAIKVDNMEHRPAGRADHAAWPTTRHEVGNTIVSVRKVKDCVLKSLTS